ncbi:MULTISPECIES: segregation/condensation protein A [Shouchella]|uniref:Segregation and condensation protein A n=3 Tax=Bacillaceae TaxID=186817 RepID=A0A060LWV9_9BACI|nr:MULTISPECIES: segregation/condensation protein A [Bacillaceae]RQW20538.1 segregation/condensation protein A [Bacillus sp. C1-1]AIC94677.1 segregation and condensation protein A [Shouchella lehensis G1]KQL51774.1 segregation and condensation protein A [Alkalicoccobacillus plakortidis]MBG9784445.1 segregation and condensation protein A [Shouchella lehensis]TES50551.1 segregation/condensation protein A [Shouchella lehensis]
MTIYNVKTPLFEGPLDLLLHLISQAEVDIYDIPVATITDQYLEFIHTMQELELDIASEYLVMAATLLQIKSQMLLPKPEELFDESEQWVEEDPRDELVEQLIEYKTYKEAAKHLKDQEEVRHSLHTRKPEELDHFLTDEEERQLQIQHVTLVDMLGAFQKMLQRNAWNRPKTKVVHTEEQSVEQRIVELLDKLDEMSGPTRFSDLVEQDDRSSTIVSFLAILELIKTSTIYCVQDQSFDEITIFLRDGDKHER